MCQEHVWMDVMLICIRACGAACLKVVHDVRVVARTVVRPCARCQLLIAYAFTVWFLHV